MAFTVPSTSSNAFQNDFDDGPPEEFTPLTRLQAQQLREQQPPVSPWRVIGLQSLAGLVVAMLAWGVTGKASAGWTAWYGALVVILPAALFARGLMSQFTSLNAATASFGFFVWQAFKLAASVVMVAAAPRLVADLNWLALMAGLVVTLKMYWVSLLFRPEPLKRRFDAKHPHPEQIDKF